MFRFLTRAAISAAFVCGAFAQSPTPTTLAAWTFEGTTLAAQYVATSGQFASGSTFVPVSANPSVSGSGQTGSAVSITGFPSSGANATAGFQFCVPSTGYAPTTVTFALRRSNTGPFHAALGYRLSSTAAWVDAWAANTIVASAFDTYTINVGTDSAIVDRATLCWRIVATVASGTAYAPALAGSTYAPTGTMRIDNLAVLGASAVVAAPSSTASGSATATPSGSLPATLSGTPSPGALPSESSTASAPGSVTASPTSSSAGMPSGTGTITATGSATATRSGSPSAAPTPPVIAAWLFDDSTTVASVGASATFAVSAGLTASYAANGLGQALSLVNFPGSGSNATAGVTFCASTEGYAPAFVTVDLRRSNTGARHAALQLRTSASGSWRDVAMLAASAGQVFDSYPIALPADSALSYNPALCFRIVSIFAPNTTSYAPAAPTGSNYGAGGTLRVDNLFLTGPVAEPPSPTGSPSGTASVSSTPSGTASVSGSGTAAATASGTASGGTSPTATASTSVSATPTPSGTASGTPSPSGTPPTAVAIVGFSFDGSSLAPTNGSLAGAPASVVAATPIGGVVSSYLSNAPLGMTLSLTTFPGTGANATAGLSVCVSTIGWVPSTFSVSLRRSNTGPRHVALQVRTSAAGAWVDAGALPASAGSVFDPYSIQLPADAALANNAALCLRLVSMFAPDTTAYAPAAPTGSTYGSGGTLRIEDLYLFGQPTTPPTPSGTGSASRTSSGTVVPSVAATPSGTCSVTGSGSATPSASNSAGASPTGTSSGSAQPSATASATGTASSTASGTGSVPPAPTVLAAWDFDGSSLSATAGLFASSAAVAPVGGAVATFVSNTPLGLALLLTNFTAVDAANATAGLQFCVPTDGYAPVSLSVSLRRSNTGPRHSALQVRSYAAGPWVDVAMLAASAATVFDAYSVSLAPAVAADGMLANSPSLCFQIVSIFAPNTTSYAPAAPTGSNYGAGGTLRFEALTLTGRVTAPSSPTPTPSNSRTASGTPSGTPSPSGTGSVPATPSGTASSSVTASVTPSASGTMPEIPSGTPTATASVSVTATASSSAAPSVVPVFTLVAYPFESSLAPGSTSFLAGAANATVIGGLAPSYLGGNPAGSALSLTGFPAQGANSSSAGVRFCVPTVGFAPFRLTVDLRRSPTGPKHVMLQAASASWAGVYVDVAPLTASNGNIFDRYVVALNASTTSGAPDLANAGDLCLRIVAVFAPSTSAYEAAATGSSYGSAGTLRIDNLALFAVATALPSATPSASVSASTSLTATPTGSVSATASFGSTASATGTATGSVSGSATATRSGTSSVTPSRTSTASRTPSATVSGAGSATGSSTATRSGTVTASGTALPTASGTSTRTSTASSSGTRSQSAAVTGTATASPSTSGSETSSVSATGTATGSVSATQTGTPSSSETGSASGTPSSSSSPSGTETPAYTGTATGSATGTQTPSRSATGTGLPTGTATKTRVPAMPSRSGTATRTRTKTATRTRTKTKTRTPSKKRKMLRA